MSNNSENIAKLIKNRLLEKIISKQEFRDEITFLIDRKDILEVCRILKEEFSFTLLIDLTAVDYLEVKSPRYEVVYYLHRFGSDYEDNSRIRLKVQLEDEATEIDSVTSVWKGADWLEREVFDMFGIKFYNHPDLRRILMPEDYDQYPLRKDFDVRNREPSKISFKKAIDEGNF